MGWLWSGLGWVLLALGVGVVAWALFWDRAGWRGRAGLRCRKCCYDLAGVGEVEEKRRRDGETERRRGGGKERPAGRRPHHWVVCPECGAGHGSVRAMRRTRRRWGWVVVGVVVIVASRSITSYPKIQDRGWWQAVPSWALILSMPRLPGYVQNPDLEWGSIAYGRSSPHERAMANLFWRDRAEELGWLDYQLAAWLARTESTEFLCRKDRTRYDGVSPRAAAYGLLLESGIRRGQLGEWHHRWYRRLVHVELRTRDRWPAVSPIWAYPDVRRAMGVHAYQYALRLRFWSPARGPYIVDAYGNVRDLRFTEEVVEALPTDGWMAPYNVSPADRLRWSDGMMEVPARDPENGTARTQVQVSEFRGRGGSSSVLEQLVGDYELAVQYERVERVEDVVRVVSSEDVLSELRRCLSGHAFWWHDALGRRRLAIAIDLTGAPRLPPGRYTFGSRLIGVHGPGRTSLRGTAWWAVEVGADGTATMVHDRTFVLVYGGVSGSDLADGATSGWELDIHSNPMFCLRDLDATTVIKGRITLPIVWERVQSRF